MSNARKNIELDEFKKEQEKRKLLGIKRAQKIDDVVTKARDAKFTLIYGSTVQPKWFIWLMEHGSRFMFSLVLVGFIISLGISIYKFVTTPNKNINQISGLAWNIAKIGTIVAAVLISLLAAPALAVVTAGMFVASMATDTLINIGLLAWNVFKLAHLRFTLRKRLNDKNESLLTKIKYEALKKKYLDEIKGTALASVIGTVLTIATAVIFLFPHVGLATIAATPVAIGAMKLTVAGIAGISAVAAILIPVVAQLSYIVINKLSEKLSPSLKTGFNKVSTSIQNSLSQLGNYFKSALSQFTKPAPQLNENQQRQHEATHLNEEIVQDQQVGELKRKVPEEKQNQSEIIAHPELPKPKLEITEDNYENSMGHSLDSNTFTKHSQMRELIIEHIQNPVLAKKAMKEMVDAKIGSLTKDMRPSENHKHSHVFAEKVRSNQEQKLHAMIMLKAYLNLTSEDCKIYEEAQKKYAEVFNRYQQYFSHPDLIKHADHFEAYQLLNYFEKTLPGIKQSFFRDQSDTENLIEAFKFYVQKFPENAPDYEPYKEEI